MATPAAAISAPVTANHNHTGNESGPISQKGIKQVLRRIFQFTRPFSALRIADLAMRLSGGRQFAQVGLLLAAYVCGSMPAFAASHYDHIIYQLHDDGSIWRLVCYQGSCGGWQQMDNQALSVYGAPTRILTGSGFNQPGNSAAWGTSGLYQLHHNIFTGDFSMWESTGFPFSWTELDFNASTKSLATSLLNGTPYLFQLHGMAQCLLCAPNDFSIWMSTGQACDSSGCPGWQELDSNSATTKIIAAGGQPFNNGSPQIPPLLQLHQSSNDTSIWQYTGTTGTPCCAAWRKLDQNNLIVDIAGITDGSMGHNPQFFPGGSIFQLHSDGSIWRYTGTPCNGNACPGWQPIDSNSAGTVKAIVAAEVSGQVFKLLNNGQVWQFSGVPFDWVSFDAGVQSIAASNNAIVELRNDGSIWWLDAAPDSAFHHLTQLPALAIGGVPVAIAITTFDSNNPPLGL
jgi:hypothetical protein